jgi:hypothetical protein
MNELCRQRIEEIMEASIHGKTPNKEEMEFLSAARRQWPEEYGVMARANKEQAKRRINPFL